MQFYFTFIAVVRTALVTHIHLFKAARRK